MIVIPGRIPISIHPFFWVFAGFIGWLGSQTLVGTLVWVGIIFVSVLFHEFGHALTALLFRQDVKIQLVTLGGLTSYNGPKLSFFRQFIIVLNGPLAGFLLAVIALTLMQLPLPLLAWKILRWTAIANIFWSAVNLVPVLPLDGGQLLRIALEGLFGVKGFRASLLIGALCAITLCFFFFLMQNFLVGAFFFLFAFQSFDLWRKSKHTTPSDRDDSLRKELFQAEALLGEGKTQEAKKLFEELCEKGKGGVLAQTATQYLSFIYVKEGKKQEAYQLLLPLHKDLSDEALCLLHQLAFECSNTALVAELSAECYRISPSRDVAMRNARAFAALHQARLSGGWLQTAWQYGSFDLSVLLQEQVFADIRNDRVFQEFIAPLQQGL